VSRLLVVNAGSTSLKLSVVDDEDRSESIDRMDAAGNVDAVVHRVVHGGSRFRSPVVVDRDVRGELDELTDLAPLHNRPALRALDDATARFPDVPQIAVFDTAFHASLDDEAAEYAVPRAWRDEWGVRRYGFHGLSVAWSARRIPVPRLVVCHLGGGCSVTAVLDGRSVDTTMGFSPLEGVPMATRSGSIDAEVVLHLLRRGLIRAEEIELALEHESGLLGLSGESGSVQELERSGSPAAELALAVYTYRLACAVAASTVALGGLDAIAFTAGVGEGSARIRRDVCQRLAHLGVGLDQHANTTARPDCDVATDASVVRVHVVHAREDVVAAHEARRILVECA
jgi:acetate kinase